MTKPRAIEVLVYFVDPKDLWAGKMDKLAIIYSTVVRLPWMWLARLVAAANQGNTGNTGYLIRDLETGELLEIQQPTRPWVTGL